MEDQRRFVSDPVASLFGLLSLTFISWTQQGDQKVVIFIQP